MKKYLAIILLIIALIINGYFIYNIMFETHNHSEGAVQISTQVRKAFNKQFEQYEKIQSGKEVNDLLQTMIANCNSYKDESDRLPDLVIETNDGIGGYVISDKKTSDNPLGNNVRGFSYAKLLLEIDHDYYVCVEHNPKTGFVDLIFVSWTKGDFDNYEYDYDENGKIIDLSRYGGTAFDGEHKKASAMNLNRK